MSRDNPHDPRFKILLSILKSAKTPEEVAAELDQDAHNTRAHLRVLARLGVAQIVGFGRSITGRRPYLYGPGPVLTAWRDGGR